MKEKIRIGCGAGFSGDRFDAALKLVRDGNLDYLVLECLAERTIAIANKTKLADHSKGFDPLLERRMYSLLPDLIVNKVRLITNMGAANPLAAGKIICEIAKKLSLSITVAVITGDDVLLLLSGTEVALETGQSLKNSGKIVSANAYLGAEAIIPGLINGANIIITGRVADPSLFVAPLAYEFNWQLDNYNLIGQATVIGHLLECAGQLSGGYFADASMKTVPDLENLGHPFADVFKDGTAIFGKVLDTGGIINLATVKEQLLYEVMDPSRYITPDVIADFTHVHLEEISLNQVKVTGGKGITKPNEIKVSVGYDAGFLGEGEISYAGHHAFGRAKLAAQIIQARLKHQFKNLHIDFIGCSSMYGLNFEYPNEPFEVRLRVACNASTKEQAALIGEEVEALYTNGPAGGGGARKYVNNIVGIHSIFIERNHVTPKIEMLHT